MKENPRKISLERLASPEQIDRLLVIVRVPGWIALWCLVLLVCAILVWAFVGSIPMTAEGAGLFFNPKDMYLIQSEKEGRVKSIEVTEGQYVKKGAPLITLTDEVIKAPFDGSVLTIETILGERIDSGKTLIWFHIKPPDEAEDLFYAFFPVAKGELLREGMEAQIVFDEVNTEKYGKMVGKVKRILPFSVSKNELILRSLPTELFQTCLGRGEASLLVEIIPLRDPETRSGFVWTKKEGPPYALDRGAVGDVMVLIQEKRPISYLISHD